MVPRQQFINKLRELDYTFKDQTKRGYIWRKKGGQHFIYVTKADLIEDEVVASALRQAGLKEDEIQSFLGCAHAPTPRSD